MSKNKKNKIMERTVILSKLNEIFVDVLDLEESPNLTENTTSEDIEEWDSLAHVQLVVAIQKEFGIKINANEILNWRNVGEMVNSICKSLQ